jgi:hypothetical protein
MEFMLYVVFHKFLVPECYETLSGEHFRHLRFLAVNGKIEKKIPEALAPYVLEERRLGWYDPFLQHNRFCESSAFVHVWKNPELMRDYVGFLHYDMLLDKGAIEFLEEQIRAAHGRSERVLFTHVTLTAWRELNQVISIAGWQKILDIYAAVFGTRHNIMDILNEKIPLYHTFVVDRETFAAMMTFAEKAIPVLFELIGYDTTHLPFMLERLHGVFLLLRRIDGAVHRWIPLPGITHLDRLKDSWK